MSDLYHNDHAQRGSGPKKQAISSLLLAVTLASSLATAEPLKDPKKRGQEIFKTTCSVCHGEKGNGAMWGKLKPPARNFTSAASFAKLTRKRMIYSVTNGRPGTAMQAFKKQLTAEEIEAVVDYVRETFIATGKPNDMTLALPNELTGDKVAGGVLFQANCSPCHGPRGNGQGPRAYFINPKPRNFLADSSRRWLNKPELFRIISRGSPGTDMPSWNKVLTDQQIANVAEYVFHQFIKPETDELQTRE